MIRQFDIVANPEAGEAVQRPYLVILQSDLISGLASTVVAPLIPRDRMTGADRLNPLVSVEGREFWLATHELFAVDRRILQKQVGRSGREPQTPLLPRSTCSSPASDRVFARRSHRTTPEMQHGLRRGRGILLLR